VKVEGEYYSDSEDYDNDYEEYSSSDASGEIEKASGSPSFKPKKTKTPKSQLTDLAFIDFGPEVSYAREEVGIRFVPDFLNSEEMLALLQNIEEGTWTPDKQNRQVQIFGYNFLSPDNPHASIPSYFESLRDKMEAHGFGKFTELLIADYAPGVGVDPHVDRFFWGERVVGLSLISHCTMNLSDFRTEEEHTLELTPGSIYCLEGRARYEFAHGIEGKSVTERRVSLTFRTLASQKAVVWADTPQFVELQ
jgi:alkylated DNA repair dioxygenase AlkB